jgi:hypothetical protein
MPAVALMPVKPAMVPTPAMAGRAPARPKAQAPRLPSPSSTPAFTPLHPRAGRESA